MAICLVKLFTSPSEKGTYIKNSSFARPMSLPTPCGIRLGIRLCLPDGGVGSSLTGSPQFSLGLSSGTINIPGDANMGTYTGMAVFQPTWTLGSGIYSFLMDDARSYGSSALANGGKINTNCQLSVDPSLPQAFFIDQFNWGIFAGDPQTGIQAFLPTAIGGGTFCSSGEFYNLMTIRSPVKSGYTYTATAIRPQDFSAWYTNPCFSFWWNREDMALGVLDIAVSVF